MTPEDEEKLKNLLILSIKELGEIAETLVKKDRPEHLKNELGDMCGLCILPMLKLSGMTFENACEIGLNRKRKKLEEKNIIHRNRDTL